MVRMRAMTGMGWDVSGDPFDADVSSSEISFYATW